MGHVYQYEVTYVTVCNEGHDHYNVEDYNGPYYGSNIKNNGILDEFSEADKKLISTKLIRI